jgi:NADH-quinone oxidoreductase subunit N
MNDLSAIGLELAIVASGLVILLLDLWTAPAQKRLLAYAAALAVGAVFVASFAGGFAEAHTAFGGRYVADALALFFKRFLLLGAGCVLIMSAEFSSRFDAGVGEYPALVLFALAGMMFAASAGDFSLLFVSLELITVTFYVLSGFQRRQRKSLEAGIKYMVLGALASAFLVFGIALVFGSAGTLRFDQVASQRTLPALPLFQVGLGMVLVGLGFKLALVPFQLWVPDVYQGAPAPTTAFLAVGSKAAGIVLLLRVLFQAVPPLGARWTGLLVVLSGATIAYGVLCAIPQRNLKRLLAYSSIANAGYLLLGVAAGNAAGTSAVLYYLAGYLFAVVAAFLVICLAFDGGVEEDLGALAGLHRRAPLPAAVLSLAMISLAGIPPLAGFMGKFLLLKSVLGRGAAQPWFYGLAAVAILGVVISIYYYLGVVRAVYWAAPRDDRPTPAISAPARWCLYACAAGLVWLGVRPDGVVLLAEQAVRGLHR